MRVLKDQNIKLKRNSPENQMKRSAGLDDIPDMPFGLEKEESPKPLIGKCTINNKLPGITHDLNEQVRGPSSTNEDKDKLWSSSSSSIQGSSFKNSIPCGDNSIIVEERHDPRPVSSSNNGKNDAELVNSDNKVGVSRSLSLRNSRKRNRACEAPNIDDEVICFGDTNPAQTSVHNGKETSSSTPVSEPGKSNLLILKPFLLKTNCGLLNIS